MRGLLASLLGTRFWLLAYVLLGLGLATPYDVSVLQRAIPYMLGGVLFFTCLKVDLRDVQSELRPERRLRPLAVSAVELLVLPAIVFLAARWLVPEWALGLLLVAAMPAGMSSVAFTDVQRGNVALALLVLLLTSVSSPLTIPLLLDFGQSMLTTDKHVSLSLAELARRAGFIAVLLAVPFFAAQVVRRLAPGWVGRHQARFTPAALLFLALLIYVATAATRQAWLDAGPVGLVAPLLAVTAVCALALLAARILGGWLGRRAAIAMACGSIYVNNGLAVAFGLAFFSDRPQIALTCILSTVPMVWFVSLVGRVLQSLPDENAGTVSG